MRTLMTIPAVVRRFEKSTDIYGNELRDNMLYTDTAVKCWVHQQASGLDAEDTVDRDQSVGKYVVFVYGDADVRSNDVIFVGDYDGSGDDLRVKHEVYGPPQKFYNRQGRVNHLQILTRVVEG
jgi:hypothetical protein